MDFIYNTIKRIEETLKDCRTLNMNRSIQLDNYSCAAHCVYMILEYYKIPKTLNEILNGLKTSKRDGTDTEPILNYLRINSLEVEINTHSKLSQIHSAIDSLNPILISVDNVEHWVVIYGYNREGIFVLDPSKKKLLNHWSISEFIQHWDDNWTAIIRKE